MKNKCTKCGGSGYFLGNGMIKTLCDKCEDDEYSSNSMPSLDKLDRTTISYKKAIKDIMETSKVSRKIAVEMFDKAYVKN